MMNRLRDMPLRYRLSIPFFFLALFGTFSLVGLAIISQDAIIKHEERERLYGYDRALAHILAFQGRWAVSLASTFARNPEIVSALAEKDRLRLIQLCYPAYVFMKEEYGISQFSFHVLPPRMFLRLERLYEFGDDLSYRQTILDAIFTGREIYGLEQGLGGYSIRGVAPVFERGNIIGTVEIGFSFGSNLMQWLKKQFDIEVSILLPDKSQATFRSFSTTFPGPIERTDPVYARVYRESQPQILIGEFQGRPYAILVRTVYDYQGNPVGLVEFCVNRKSTIALLTRYRRWMICLGIIGMLLSVGGIYIISSYFTRPIGRMISFARSIAQEEPVEPLESYPSGELGVLAQALDDMLDSLNESRRKIRDYMDNLETMVQERTRALKESEEKYRTLVENVPLVVYRTLGNGRVIFINHYIEVLMGIPVSRVLEDPTFWKQKVWVEDRPRIWPLMDLCLEEGRTFREEYRVADREGNLVYVMDHAIPVLDEEGNVETVDGFLMDVGDRHRLQQQIIQTEELRTLSQISARLAHEIRNPLVSAGGFARRLLHSLPPDEKTYRPKVEIIVREVARLEKILETTLSYLEPIEIVPEKSSVNELVERVLEDQRDLLEAGSMQVETLLSPSLPMASIDPLLFRNALDSILGALLSLCSFGSKLRVRTYWGQNVLTIDMEFWGIQISLDDIDHFFYPFTTHESAQELPELPLAKAKMIIHRHGGLITLEQKHPHQLTVRITLPL
ncbi:MAG: PAS domain S-box protein [Syntrophobacteraceae bacterium]|nr:PAS domain S-box protein [Syntrophobacteraceae bacterium]